MKTLELLAAQGLALLLQSTVLLSDASARECWSAVGATATPDEQSGAFIVMGAIPTAPTATDSPPPTGGPPVGPAVSKGQTFGLRDHMVSLKSSAPAGTHILRYSSVPTSYFDSVPDHLLSAFIFVQDNKRDRVVVQLKEIRYRTTAVPIDPKPQVKTIALVDSAFDPFNFQDNVPSGQFVVLHDPFAIAGTTQIPIPDSPPFVGREFVHYYLEVMLITNREPPAKPPIVGGPIGQGSGEIKGPALALVALCPSMEMTSCFFADQDFKGQQQCLRGNETVSALDPSLDNRISSMIVARGGLVLVCDKPNFNPTGWCETYAGGVPRLTGDRNDSISSIMRIR